MAKVFSIASWNVEHFKDDLTRVGKVIDLVKAQNPDVFGLYEVEGAKVFNALVDKMPDYTFQITEGVQTQEILVGISKRLTAFITQKTEFRSGTTHMRPGRLSPVTNGKNYALLSCICRAGPTHAAWGCATTCSSGPSNFAKSSTAPKAAPVKRVIYSSATSTRWG